MTYCHVKNIETHGNGTVTTSKGKPLKMAIQKLLSWQPTSTKCAPHAPLGNLLKYFEETPISVFIIFNLFHFRPYKIFFINFILKKYKFVQFYSYEFFFPQLHP